MFHPYMTSIFNYFNTGWNYFQSKIVQMVNLRYGEILIKSFFFGDFDAMFNKLHGKIIIQ
jgi:phosphoribosylaminoimidazolecarboxamide formyltransferase/IMP cyclohydrolase